MDLWKFLAGLGLFLYGISLMQQVTKRLAGRSFKLFLRKHTNSLAKAIIGGTTITGLVQSSSVIILMLMSFVGAGIISFRNALGVLIGSNLGSTVDSWFIATMGFTFNLLSISFPLIAITSIAMFFSERRRQLYDSLNFIFSIAILLLGFGFMKEAAEQLVLKFNLADYANYNLFFILLTGFVITVLIQSSAATVAIALTALHAHALTFPAAACLIIGSEVGTTIKFLFGSINASTDRKMLGWGDFFFNVFTAVASFIFLSRIIFFIQDILQIKNPLIGLVFFQSFINFMSILIIAPFMNLFAKLLEKMFRKTRPEVESGFNNTLPVIPELATSVLQKASTEILLRVLGFHKKIFGASATARKGNFSSRFKSFTRIHGTTDMNYDGIKETEGDILNYYNQVQKKDPGIENYEKTNKYLTAIRESIHAAKSVHDIRHDLISFQSSANNFLFNQYTSLQKEWQNFESLCRQMLVEENRIDFELLLDKTKTGIFNQFQDHKNTIEKTLDSKELDGLDASTLLNVYQEMLSSEKALLKAIDLLKS
jgi:phosphate:Na+ symporter